MVAYIALETDAVDNEAVNRFYVKNGFTLVEESVYEKFSTETEKYKTYVFKKAIE